MRNSRESTSGHHREHHIEPHHMEPNMDRIVVLQRTQGQDSLLNNQPDDKIDGYLDTANLVLNIEREHDKHEIYLKKFLFLKSHLYISR